MKKIVLSLAAFAALSTAALAERHYDLRDTPEAQGSFSTAADRGDTSGVLGYGSAALTAVDGSTNVLAIDDIYDAHGFRR